MILGFDHGEEGVGGCGCELFLGFVGLCLVFLLVFGVGGGVLRGEGVWDLVVEVVIIEGFFWGHTA